jgi:hypothetical protein
MPLWAVNPFPWAGCGSRTFRRILGNSGCTGGHPVQWGQRSRPVKLQRAGPLGPRPATCRSCAYTVTTRCGQLRPPRRYLRCRAPTASVALPRDEGWIAPPSETSSRSTWCSGQHAAGSACCSGPAPPRATIDCCPSGFTWLCTISSAKGMSHGRIS